MKILIQLGREYWIAPDFQTAAKIADLLGKCRPVAQDYLPNITPHQVYFTAEHGDYPHEVEVRTIPDACVVTRKQHDELTARNEQAKT